MKLLNVLVWAGLLCSSTLTTLAAAPGSQWVAFNDQGAVGNPNDTAYTIASLGTSSGALKSIDSGGALPVSLSITNNPGPAVAGTMAAPNPGTPAYNIFNGYIDWTTAPDPGFHIYPTNTIGYRFTGLNPNNQYKFVATSVRGGTAPTPGNEYTNRWTQAELVEADREIAVLLGRARVHPQARIGPSDDRQAPPGSLDGLRDEHLENGGRRR